jgi:RNA polymerase sigma-70 factor (ECF subfamily)
MSTCLPQEIDAETPLTDVVCAAQEGCGIAFSQIVERFERLVYGLALRRMGNHAEAQEVVQEVFMQALRKIGQLREPSAIAGWLRSITVRRVNNRVTRRAPLTIAEPETLDAVGHESETPLEKALAHERQSQVRAGLKRLGTLDRQTLEAFYVDGKSLIEMSTDFESPVGTIKRRLHVARKRLARELESII